MGTQFQSATGNGAFLEGAVNWNIGSLAPNVGGRELLTVKVDTLVDGTTLLVDAAVLSGNINFQSREARAMAVSRVYSGELELNLEINPGPVNPGQLIDSQITVSNPTGNVSGALSLRVLWPEELYGFVTTTSAGSCPGSCRPGEYMTWNLGNLGPNSSVTVSFNTTVLSLTENGRIIPIEAELYYESGLPARNISHSIIVQADSPLELSISPLPDPVSSGAKLVYELTYGNSGEINAENSRLDFPIPTGNRFLSASGGAQFSDGNVVWDFGRLAPGVGGKQQVTVEVDILPDGTLILVDAAVLSGDINFQGREAREMAVSRVAPVELDIELNVNPNPVEPGQLLNTKITVENPTVDVFGAITLRLLWPEELYGFPDVTDGGRCPGSCQPGEYLSWDLGAIGPGGKVVVSFSTTVLSLTSDGTLIPLEVELLEGGLPEHTVVETVLVNVFTDFDEDGEPDVFDDDDDNDGMPDWCEIRYGLNPFDPSDADDDPDEDGLTNLEECLAGTDPFVNNDLIFKDSFESL